MKNQEILDEFLSLPTEAQNQVVRPIVLAFILLVCQYDDWGSLFFAFC